MIDAFICDAVRTPIGKYNDALSSIRTDDLAALPIKALMRRNFSVDWTSIDDVIYGCANQSGEDNRNVSRMASLLAGLPYQVAGTTVNRLCGSGLDALSFASRSIKSGEMDFIIVGGVENMSRAPFVMGKADAPFSRNCRLEDTTMGWRFINSKMESNYGVDPMPLTAERLAKQYKISREAQDIFALNSQNKVREGYLRGHFDDELIPVSIDSKKGKTSIIFSKDEHPRNTTIEQLSKLPSITGETGTITAGNASGINDGAGAILVANQSAVIKNKLIPKARIVASAVSGVKPGVMGIGPVSAIEKLLHMTKINLNKIDIIEINEAFSAQTIAVIRQLGLSETDKRINPNGGAIALGHPLAASGIRLVATAYYQLLRTNGKYALCSMCIGVGQGIALLLERI